MKYIIASLLTVGLASCMTGYFVDSYVDINCNQVEKEERTDVSVFHGCAGGEVIGSITVRGTETSDEDDLIDRACSKASKYGADAISQLEFYTETRRKDVSAFDDEPSTCYEALVLDCTVVKW